MGSQGATAEFSTLLRVSRVADGILVVQPLARRPMECGRIGSPLMLREMATRQIHQAALRQRPVINRINSDHVMDELGNVPPS